jgi:hypothetical protein
VAKKYLDAAGRGFEGSNYGDCREERSINEKRVKRELRFDRREAGRIDVSRH